MVKKSLPELREKSQYAGAAPADVERVYGTFARIMIQVGMRRQDVGYRELTEMLNYEFSQQENERNVRNKVARGTFSAAFFLMCMEVLGETSLAPRLEDTHLVSKPIKGE
jgi:hypothetical protein